MFRVGLSLIFCLLFTVATAQKKNAQKLFNEANLQLTPEKTIPLLQKAIAKDSSYSEAYLNLAHQYNQKKQYELQIATLATASEKCERKRQLILAQLSKAAYLNADYQTASNAISELNCQNSQELQQLKNCINFSIEAVSHPITFNAVNLGTAINTKYNDYWPSLSIDEKEIVTTVFLQDSNSTLPQEDLFISQKDNNKWRSIRPVSKIINTQENEGAQCLSADGKIMLFTACNRRTGYGACDIYISYKKGNTWTAPRPLPSPINTEYWEGHPCLSADGSQLFFSSDRKGGIGGRDLYVAQINLGKTVQVTSVKNLGIPVNTNKDEISPFIHPDGETLYFSSNGHTGLGRQDIYYSKRDSSGNFASPINFGYPINTNKDEIGLIINAKGNTGYFSCERKDSRQKDIYTFNIPTEVRPVRTTYLKALVKDKENRNLLNANIEVRDLNSSQIIYSATNTHTFVTPLTFGKEYAISISCLRHLFFSERITLKQQTETPFEKEILLAPIRKGEKTTMKNVLFKVNSFEIDTGYTAELDKTLQLINNNPDFHFEIMGHTDNTGSKAYNQQLSEQRAKSVYNYLIQNGADKERLSYKGYGDTQPISDDNKMNRRTELLVK